MYTGPFDEPEVNVLPNVPTTELFCLMARILLCQPSPHESLIVMLRTTELGSGHPPIGQNVENIVAAVKVLPLVLWKIIVPF